MNKKGLSTRLDMNDLEKKFLLEFEKVNNGTATIKKNTESFTIWKSDFINIKDITYTPDFVATITDKGITFKAYYEVKGWSRSNEMWDLKRKLVKNYFMLNMIMFEEYRLLGKEFFEYGEWKFEIGKRKKVKEWTKRVNNWSHNTLCKNYINAKKKLDYWTNKKYDKIN